MYEEAQNGSGTLREEPRFLLVEYNSMEENKTGQLCPSVLKMHLPFSVLLIEVNTPRNKQERRLGLFISFFFFPLIAPPTPPVCLHPT